MLTGNASSAMSNGISRFSRSLQAWRLLLVIGALILLCASASAAMLDPVIQKKVQAATFEVVLPKPADDRLSYEKPLPLDLLPYLFRTDKYFSVGTAFAIGGGRYVTAAHVFAIAVDGLWGAPALRNTAGRVFAVAQIEKYSEHEDFVVFTLAAQPSDASALEINPAPVLNETVYSVGNALGDGVVIRDGLYTSDTPENQDGRWKWLRFSAAASPGNSGGPLLDKEGRAIGVVLMKSPNENLNYAVSMDQVMKAPAHLARIDMRKEFRLDVFDKVKTAQFKQEFPLPKSFNDFAATWVRLREDFDAGGYRDLLAENAGEIFPQGSGSEKLLHSFYEKTFPALLVRRENGVWDLDSPRYSHADLGDSGSVDTGRVLSQTLLHLRKPANVDSARLYADAEFEVQLTLQGAPLFRQVGPEKVKITALGKPSEDSTFSDAWGRVWQLRSWPMAYDNTVLISLDLPVPDGYVSMRRIAFARSAREQSRQMKTLADFVTVSYAGSLNQWRDFLRIGKLLPSTLSPEMIRVDAGRSFEYRSRRLSFAYTPELQKIDKDSRLILDFGFFAEAGKTVWDVSGIAVHEDGDGKTEVGAFRHLAPSAGMDETYQKSWDKRLHHMHPYDGVAFQEDGMQYIRSIYGQADATPVPKVLYTFLYRAESGTAQETMKAKLDLLMKNAHVDEH